MGRPDFAAAANIQNRAARFFKKAKTNFSRPDPNWFRFNITFKNNWLSKGCFQLMVESTL